MRKELLEFLIKKLRDPNFKKKMLMGNIMYLYAVLKDLCCLNSWRCPPNFPSALK